MLIINFVTLFVVIQIIPILTVTCALATTFTFVFGALLGWIEVSFFGVARVLASQICGRFRRRALACALTASITVAFATLI
jgi:hypothetical protein